MNTPIERRATRLACTTAITLGLSILVTATVAAVHGDQAAVNYAVLAVILIAFSMIALVEANRAAKR